MNSVTSWFLRNPVAANLLMVLILFLGAQTLFSIRIEGFPRVPPESVDITVEYPGASAAQVDELVTRKIEEALEGLPGIRSVTSESQNGYASISVRRAGGTELKAVLERVRLRLGRLGDLPDKARRPVIEAAGFDFPALYVNVHGQTDPATLQKLAARLKADLLAEPEISRLKIWGLVPQELRIETDPVRLQHHGVTVGQIADAVRAHGLTAQAGKLLTKNGAILLRTDQKAGYAPEFAALPIRVGTGTATVPLSELARIQEGFTQQEVLFRFNGNPTIGMEILVGQQENLLLISEVVRRVIADFERSLPDQIQVQAWGDSAGFIADRLALLQSNGVQGLLLVLLMLSIFLNVRLAFWVAMGIPVSILGALAVGGSKWVDYSLNDVTTFGLIIALGILVDDAIVVGESVYEERQQGGDALRSTERGVKRVSVATVFGVLTTIAAFYPMLMIDNPMGKVLASFSGIVILTLVFSLIESKLILPAHLARVPMNTPRRYLLSRMWGGVQDGAQAGLMAVRDRVYRPALEFSLVHRYAVLILFCAAGALGLGMMVKGKIGMVFFPDVPGQIISVNLEMDARAPFALTRANIDRIEAEGRALNAELAPDADPDMRPIESFFTIIETTGNALMYAELRPPEDRPGIETLDVARLWQARVGAVEGATELEFSGSEDLAGGFQVRLMSRDEDALRSASAALRQSLAEVEGLRNLRDGMVGGQPELKLSLRPEARNMGFTVETLTQQIGSGFGGDDVARVRREGAEVRVIVQNERAARDTIFDLLQTPLRSDTGKWVPLNAVARVEGSYASGTLHRQNGERVVMVRASVDRGNVSPSEVGQYVMQELVPELTRRFPNVDIALSGELEEMGEIKGALLRALMLAALLIYVLMAIPLASYWQPFVILAIVPFGFVAAAVGHLIMGMPFSLFSFFGMLALTGVIVNDSLVLITRYNQLRVEGSSVATALREAGLSRFRAIFLTTATTVIGLTPLLSETSEQAQYLIPAAVSLAFGELFGTALMLVLVPVLIAITEDVLAIFAPGPDPATSYEQGETS